MPSRSSRLRNTVLDLVLPFGGPSYERARAKHPPRGWTEADATVTAVERESKVRLHMGKGAHDRHEVCGTIVRYRTADGVELVDDLDLVAWDLPAVGDTERLAFDPGDHSRFKLLRAV